MNGLGERWQGEMERMVLDRVGFNGVGAKGELG